MEFAGGTVPMHWVLGISIVLTSIWRMGDMKATVMPHVSSSVYTDTVVTNSTLGLILLVLKR